MSVLDDNSFAIAIGVALGANALVLVSLTATPGTHFGSEPMQPLHLFYKPANVDKLIALVPEARPWV